MRDFELDSADIDQLNEQGFFVRDSFLDRDICRVIRRSIERRAREANRHAAGLDSQRRDHPAPEICGDYITWVDRTDGYPWDLAAECFDRLRLQLNRMGYLGLRDGDIQMVRYPGDGSGFDRRLDTRRRLDNRRVTATIYLNPDWSPADAGELRLRPADSEAEPVEIAPVAGRLVALRLETIDHEISPSYAPRFALSSWYRGRTPAAQSTTHTSSLSF